jgi:uncharacterized protein YbaP (TraB family)
VLRLRVIALGLLSLATAIPAASDVSSSIDELEAALVTGERPGPALWKITRKGNTLWILPTFGPLPDSLILRSTQLEAVIRESQEVHFLTRVNPPAYFENDARKQQAYGNGEGRHLRDVISPALHAQFRDLADRYASGSEMLENYRPFVAADWLKQMAMQRLHLNSDTVILATVAELARKHGVRPFGAKMKHDEVWDQMIQRLENTPRDDDAPCAKARLDRMEADLRDSVARANAWARGDITTLRKDAELRSAQKEPPACRRYFEDINVGAIQQRALQRYSYSSAMKWLRKNHSTLVLVPIADLFESDGLLRKLRRPGYKVIPPPEFPDFAASE